MSLYMPFTMNNQEYLSIGEHREHRYLLKVIVFQSNEHESQQENYKQSRN